MTTQKFICMKKIALLVILFSALKFTVNAQIRQIPSEVTEAFSSKYPTAKKVSWKDNLTNFEASYTLDNYAYTSKFNNKGEWMETDKKMTFEQLNSAIKDGFRKSKYTGWEVRGATEIQQSDKGTLYRILIRKSALQKSYLFFNVQGQLQKEQTTL